MRPTVRMVGLAVVAFVVFVFVVASLTLLWVPSAPAPHKAAAPASTTMTAVPWTPDASYFSVKLAITDKQCFGSAGCNLNIVPALNYAATGSDLNSLTCTITFSVSGDTSGETFKSFTTRGQDAYSGPFMMQTAGTQVAPAATVTYASCAKTTKP